MDIKYTKRAISDLNEICDYLEIFSKNSADNVLNSIKESIDKLEVMPLMGRVGRVKNTRELVLLSYTYIISYRVNKNSVEILSIFHTARDYPNKLN